jgi:hypothetical protein
VGQCLLPAPQKIALERREQQNSFRKGWGTGITADKMAACRWLKPRIVVAIDLQEWSPDDDSIAQM